MHTRKHMLKNPVFKSSNIYCRFDGCTNWTSKLSKDAAAWIISQHPHGVTFMASSNSSGVRTCKALNGPRWHSTGSSEPSGKDNSNSSSCFWGVKWNWLVVSTHLKNISQNGNLPQIGVKIKYVWNHHPGNDEGIQERYNTPSRAQPQTIPLDTYERNSFIACW